MPALPARKLALMWAEFGPYHRARAAALERHFRVYRIQLRAGEHPRGACGRTVTLSGGHARALSLWRALDRMQPDALLIPGYRDPLAVAAALWGRTHNTPAILMSDSTGGDWPRHAVREALKGAAIRRLFDGAIVSGKRAARYLDNLGFHAKPMGFCYDVVDNEFFARQCAILRRERTAADFGLPPEYFLFAGRFIPEKNLPGLLRAFSAYAENGGGWSLVIAGAGPLDGTIRDMIRGNRFLRRVILTGNRDYAELAPLYAFARCLVLSSVSETWGLVVNEAMASGLPVLVSSRCGCVDDLVTHGGNGFVFDPLDEPQLTRLMLAFSSMPERERLDMGARSAEIISTFALTAWADSVRGLLRVCGA